MTKPERMVRVLDADPELGRGLSPQELAQARHGAVAASIEVDTGTWRPSASTLDSENSLGLLVLAGVVMRRVELAGSGASELLGEGDLLRPWQEDHSPALAPVKSSWEVLAPLRLAVLDERFAEAVARWPSLAETLLNRAVRRSRYLSLHLAVTHITRVDERLRLTLWMLAERWGRVTPDGVVLPIRLTHQWLALLVGAHRPSVTTALGPLSRSGEILRRPDGSWLLRGAPGRDALTPAAPETA